MTWGNLYYSWHRSNCIQASQQNFDANHHIDTTTPQHASPLQVSANLGDPSRLPQHIEFDEVFQFPSLVPDLLENTVYPIYWHHHSTTGNSHPEVFHGLLSPAQIDYANSPEFSKTTVSMGQAFHYEYELIFFKPKYLHCVIPHIRHQFFWEGWPFRGVLWSIESGLKGGPSPTKAEMVTANSKYIPDILACLASLSQHSF